MTQSLIPPTGKMEVTVTGEVIGNWQYFESSWNNYAIATGLVEKSEAVEVATLLPVMGQECFQIYENLPLTEAERKKSETILSKLKEHFQPERNVIYERYMFNTAYQEVNENTDQFMIRLRKLATTCKYETLLDEMLRDRLVIGIRDNNVRSRILREPKLDLPKALDICRRQYMCRRWTLLVLLRNQILLK